MRLFVALSLFGLLAACSGDSSSVMSPWSDETGGVGGGAAGGSPGRGGSGGNGGVATTTAPAGGGAVIVKGGSRDATTAQCISTSNGGGCPVDTALLQCLQGPCGSYLSACFQGQTGPCAGYAACMFSCPCDSGRSNCELTCLTDKGTGDEICSPHIMDFIACWSLNSCPKPACLLN